MRNQSYLQIPCNLCNFQSGEMGWQTISNFVAGKSHPMDTMIEHAASLFFKQIEKYTNYFLPKMVNPIFSPPFSYLYPFLYPYPVG